jgi:hypothetical protein
MTFDELYEKYNMYVYLAETAERELALCREELLRLQGKLADTQDELADERRHGGKHAYTCPDW